MDLENMTAQEVFDTSVTYLLTQNAKSEYSVNGVMCCAYRGENGRKCAAGVFIDHDEYVPEMEDGGWTSVALKFNLSTAHSGLICLLQSMHDDFEVSDWPDRARDIADYHRLSPSKINDAISKREKDNER